MIFTLVIVFSVLFALEMQTTADSHDRLPSELKINLTTKSFETELIPDGDGHGVDLVSHMTEKPRLPVSVFTVTSTGEGINSEVETHTESPVPLVSSCTAFVMDFSEGAAAFTRCSILYARPFRLCENCVAEYLKVVNSYHEIMKGTFHDKSGLLCSDMILKSDRIQIVVQTFKFVQHLWNDCHCDSCFHHESEMTDYEISNDTLKFLELSNKTQSCFDNFTHGADVIPFTNITVDPAICNSCREDYRQLNVFYEQLLILYPDNVCMDIVDMMNSTRLCWSKEFHCSLHDVDIVPVVLLSIFFSSLPIIFYVSNKIHGTKTEKKLLKQKRMRESQINNCVEEDVMS